MIYFLNYFGDQRSTNYHRRELSKQNDYSTQIRKSDWDYSPICLLSSYIARSILRVPCMTCLNNYTYFYSTWLDWLRFHPHSIGGLSIRWVYTLQRSNSASEKAVLGIILNSIWWWDLEFEVLFYCLYTQVDSGVLSCIRVRYMDQIDLLKIFDRTILKNKKTSLKTITKKIKIWTYNESDSIIARHEINVCWFRLNQSVLYQSVIFHPYLL